MRRNIFNWLAISAMGLLFVSCSTASDKDRRPPPPEINASGTNMALVPPWSEADLQQWTYTKSP